MNKEINPMRGIRIEKITLNIGAGREADRLEKGVILIEQITGIKPIRTYTQKRIPSWNLRPGLNIGCKLTLRGKKAEDVLRRMLVAKEKKLKAYQFSNSGTFAFGVPECVDIEGVKYDPKVGVIGLECCVTLMRPGYRIKRRKLMIKSLPKKQRIPKEEAIEFIKNKFGIEIE